MGLKLCCFASGSKGNCCYVSDGKNDILIDLGISATKAERCISAIGGNPENTSVIITHAHTDHTNGVRVFKKKHDGAKLFCQSENANGIYEQTQVEPTVMPREFEVGDMFVKAIAVPHDVPCFGYVIKSGNRSVAVATDLGVVRSGFLNEISGCDLVVLECNHDEQMLKNNRNYSAQLKARIASEHGHLSNRACSEACAFLAEQGVRSFVLAHISQDNNLPDRAIASVVNGLLGVGVSDARVVAALQDKPTGLFEIC